MHFAEYSHPFDLLNPDADDSDDEEEKKRKGKSPIVVVKDEEDDGDKTEEYDSDDVSDSISTKVFELIEFYRMMFMM